MFMLLTALKYYIYELCIDVAFKVAIRNFNIKDADEIPHVGDFYRTISHIYADEYYNNCTIQSVENRVNSKGESYFLVYVSYESRGGSDIDDLNDEMETMSEDDEIDVVIIENMNDVSQMFDDGDIEFIEYGDCIALNSKYYNFFK